VSVQPLLHEVGIAVGQPTHTLDAHDCPARHACPQLPQLEKSLRVSIHAPPHVLYGERHMHVDPEQVWVAEQTCPQLPQLFRSEVTSTHTPPQIICPGGHTHVELRHDAVGGHTCPQLPQSLALLVMSTHAPPQNACPTGHGEHVPPLQISGAEHDVVQLPQCKVVVIDVSHPFAAMPSQSAYPLPQTIPQVPAVHVAVVFGAVSPGQPPPHTLQFRGSVIRLTSHPFDAIPSQFAYPGSQETMEQVPEEQLDDA
jgi:hypothetical protein